MSEQITPSKEITVGLILSWIFGGLFSLIGIVSVFSEPIPGLVMLVMAAVLLPPVTKFVDQKWKFNLSSGMKIVVIIVGFIVIGTTIDTSNVSTTKQVETQQEEQKINEDENAMDETATVDQVDGEQSQIEKNEEKAEAAEETKPTTEADTDQSPTSIKTEEEPEPTPSETVSQINAIKSAKAYLNYTGFSHDGLVAQLEYEQFPHADAVYGADNSGADWNEQAAESAKKYMEYSAFSRGGLIEQLKYEKFTQAQAEYGASAVGL